MTSANAKQVGGNHYKTGGVQHWDLVHDYRVPYLAGNATKYLTRFRNKNGVQDLEKSMHYVDKMLEKASVETLYATCSDPVPPKMITMFLDSNGVMGAEREPIRLILTWQRVSDLALAKTWIGSLIAEFDGSGPTSAYVKQD